MREIFIGIGKALDYMMVIVLAFLVLTGFKTPTQVDITSVLAVGAIVIHFVDKEKNKK